MDRRVGIQLYNQNRPTLNSSKKAEDNSPCSGLLGSFLISRDYVRLQTIPPTSKANSTGLANVLSRSGRRALALQCSRGKKPIVALFRLRLCLSRRATLLLRYQKENTARRSTRKKKRNVSWRESGASKGRIKKNRDAFVSLLENYVSSECENSNRKRDKRYLSTRVKYKASQSIPQLAEKNHRSISQIHSCLRYRVKHRVMGTLSHLHRVSSFFFFGKLNRSKQLWRKRALGFRGATA